MTVFLKPLVGLALLLASAAPQEAPPTPAPVDMVARAKFPFDDPSTIDALANLNKTVNASIQYEGDMTHYGIDELWVMFPPDGKGDCEDYALTKLGVLSMADFPIISNAKIVMVMVHDKAGGGGHAILAILLKSGAVAYLDSLNDEPMTRDELVARHYEFFDWRA